MDFRMLAVDMDDTLLGKDLKITKETIKKIQLAKKAGVKVIIATGRMFISIIPFLRQLELTDPVIVYNGAMVCRLGDKKPLLHHPIPLEYARKIARRVESAGYQLNAYINDQLYVREQTPEVLRYMQRTGVNSTKVGPIGDFLEEDPTKLLVIHDNLSEIEQLKAELRSEFGDVLTITQSKPYFIEVMAKGISKGKTLAELAKGLGIAPHEVIAIGDGLNDLEMVKWAGLGVAVANAHPELKEAADYVTGSCDEEGVAQVIDKFILRRRRASEE
ncbi:hypothetical protein BBF96_01780 [Anoxybacter fermentans]|uniref:Haloacid dehalogenase n=1 Tax=Anoxybacter fermentans TaxID=1323375 RepID=A0A3Q9HQB5_9FIRM|nr:Cof-type HAD-IIB family hydrolase [Anoxybacter fermentans]AZR72237.1 hypothetical protein BBF96_01780 [Anoxybacter fermentans]